MNKKTVAITALISIAALAILLLVVWFLKPSYNSQDATVAQESGEKYVVNGYSEKVTDPDTGNPYVYVTDFDGDTMSDEEGNAITAIYDAENEEYATDFAYIIASSAAKAEEDAATESSVIPTIPIGDEGRELSESEIASQNEEHAQNTTQKSSGDVIGKVPIQ